jgi:hypothetical protein
MKYEIKQKDVLLAVIDMDKQTIAVKNALCDWDEGVPSLRSDVRDGVIYEVPCRIATGAKGWGLAIVEEAERQGYTIEELPDIKDNGGPGSGNFGHAGRPGERGGSGKGGSMQVGVTSARPEKSDDQVAKEFTGFKKMLSGVARNVDTSLGRGGWEGGGESTFVTHYTGGDTAKAKLVQYAKDQNQDGILFMKPAGKDTEGATPITNLTFAKEVSDVKRAAIEKALVKNGFGGWTWSGNQLMLASVPAYGGTTEGHLEQVDALQKSIGTVSRVDRYAKIELIKREDYDSVLRSLKKKQ